jgi:hypothetical protein
VSVEYTVNADVMADDDPLPWLACLECARPVIPPFVCWRGTKLLLLHAECAARIGAHLIADAREAQLAADPAAHWRRRAVATVRQRLQAEEVAA